MRNFLVLFMATLLLVVIAGCANPAGSSGGSTTFTVTYNGNSSTTGTAPTDATVYKTGDKVTVLANSGSLVKTGLTFSGWNTQADGKGTTYKVADTFTMGSNNVTLYAIWASLTSTTPGTSATPTTSGTASATPSSTASATPTPTGSSSASATPIPTPTGIAGNYKVVYYANTATAGTAPASSATIATGKTFTVSANTGFLEKTGSQFGGWNTRADGKGVTFEHSSTATMGGQEFALYALWLPSVSTFKAGYPAGGPSFYLKTDGSLWSVGSGSYGQRADGTTLSAKTIVFSMSNVASIATGSSYTMILKTDGTLWAVGNNGDGVLCDGTTTDQPKPIKVLDKVSSVACGGSNTVVLKADGTLWGAGINKYGSLGLGHSDPVKTLTLLMSDVKDMALNNNILCHLVVLKKDGSVWASGYNFSKQLGRPTSTALQESTFAQITTGVTAISNGNGTTLMLKTGGNLWAVGAPENYGMSSTLTSNQSVPVLVMSDVKFVKAGAVHTLVIKNDDTVWGTGNNMNGQLGIGTKTVEKTWVKIMSDVKSIHTTSNNSAVIKNDGTLWVFGWNMYGCMGAGDTTDKYYVLTPVQLTF